MAAPMVDWSKARVVGVEPIGAEPPPVDWSKARVVGTEPATQIASASPPAARESVDWSKARVVGTEPVKTAPNPGEALAIAKGQQLKQAATAYGSAIKAIESRPDAPGNTSAIANMASPGELPEYDEKGNLTPEGLKRLPVINTGDEMKALRQKIGGRFVVPGGLMGSQVVLLDPNNVAVATLNNQASWNYWDDDLAPGFQPLPYLTGQADPLQQQMAQIVDAAMGRKPTGEMGRGMREAAADAGEQTSANPATLNAAQLWSYPTQAVRGAGAVIDATQERGFGLVDSLLKGAEMTIPGRDVSKMEGERGPQWWKDWRAENRKEMEQGVKSTREIGEARDYIASVKDPNQLDEIEAAAGRGIGEEVGEYASLVSPTALTKGVGWAAKAAPKPLRDKVGEAASIVGTELANSGVTGRVTDFVTERVAPFISRNPAAWRTTGADKDAIDAAGRTFRNSADVAGASLTEEAMEGFNRVLSRHGIEEGSEQAQKLMSDATTAINSGVEGRKNASSIIGEIIDEWQPTELKPYRQLEGKRAIDRLKMLDGDELRETPDVKNYVEARRDPENPFHRSVGDDISKGAKVTETRAARTAEAQGKEVAEMPTLTPGQVKDLPGIRQSERALAVDSKGKIVGENAPGIPPNELAQMKLVDHGSVAEYAQRRYDAVLASSKGNVIEAERARDRILKMPFPQAIGETFADVAVATGRPVREAAAHLAEYTQATAKANPAFRHASQIPEFQAPKAARRGTYAQVTQKGAVMTEPAEKMLRETDSVVLRAGGSEGGSPLVRGVVVNLPPGAEALDGWVVPRWVGIGYRDSMRNNAEFIAEKAAVVNKILGLPQIKRMLTGGNAGFDPRNIMGSLFNHVLSEGDVLTNPRTWSGLDKATRTKVAAILNAPIRGGGQAIEIGGQVYKAGDLHRALRLQASIGRGIGDEAARMAKEGSRAGDLAEIVSPKGSKALSLASDALAKPGELYNQGLDAAMREALFPGLRNYRADDAIRAWNVLSRMENGASLEHAARNMNHLFVDYSNRSNLDEVASTLIPFWKFYANSLQGALRLAVTNPSSVRRLDNLRRFVEQQDSAAKGGKLNPRFKESADHYSLGPMYENSGRAMVGRFEHPVSTAVNIAGALPEELSPIGGMEQGIGRFTGEPLNSLYGTLTGNNIVTNRSVLNLDPERVKEAKAFSVLPGLFGQLSYIYQNHPEMLGPHPEAALAYYATKYFPGLAGRLTTPQLDALVRSVLQLGGSEASRAPQNEAANLQRMATSMAAFRTAVVDPARNTAKIARQVLKRTPKVEEEIKAKEIEHGKRRAE